MRAHQIMTRNVITVTPETMIVDAANAMLAHHISGLPVLGPDGGLVGIVSEGDFLRRAEIGTQRKRGRCLSLLLGPGEGAADYVRVRGRRVGEIMTPEPVTATEEMPLEEVERALIQKALDRHGGNVNRAADALGLSRSALYRRLQQHGIRVDAKP